MARTMKTTLIRFFATVAVGLLILVGLATVVSTGCDKTKASADAAVTHDGGDAGAAEAAGEVSAD